MLDHNICCLWYISTKQPTTSQLIFFLSFFLYRILYFMGLPASGHTKEHGCILFSKKVCLTLRRAHIPTYNLFRYWAIALPVYLIMAIVFGIIVYICINFINTPPLDSFKTFTGMYMFVHYSSSYVYVRKYVHLLMYNLQISTLEIRGY